MNSGCRFKPCSWLLSLKQARHFLQCGKVCFSSGSPFQFELSSTDGQLFTCQEPAWFIYVKCFDEHLDLRWLFGISCSSPCLSLSAVTIATLSFFSNSIHKISSFSQYFRINFFLILLYEDSQTEPLETLGWGGRHKPPSAATKFFFSSSVCGQNEWKLTEFHHLILWHLFQWFSCLLFLGKAKLIKENSSSF